MGDNQQLNARNIQRRMKVRGLELRPDALSAIQSVLKNELNPASSLDKLITVIKEKMAAHGTPGCIVDKRLVSEAVLDLSKNDEDLINESITVWDAFRIPHSTYNATSRTFRTTNATEPLHGDPELKTRMLRERYSFVHQRVLRHHLFRQRLVGANDSGEAAVTLTPIDALAAGGGDPNHLHHVLGVLTRVDEDHFWLEDPNGRLPLDIRENEVTCSPGLFTVGCVVIAVGYLRDPRTMDDDGGENISMASGRPINRAKLQARAILRVTALMMPPKESRQDSEAAHPGVSRKLLGLPDLSPKDLKTMQEMEEDSRDAYFVFMSDVHLDDPATMETLEKVFDGISAYPPQLIVLMGNFSQRPFGYSSRSTSADQISASEFGDCFEQLAVMMNKYPELLTKETRWVFIPGPNDPSASPKEIYPRPTLPKSICERLADRLPETCRVSFTSNPSRIMFYNQEICFFRSDTMSKMRRNCIIPPAEGSAQHASKDLVTTLCNQGHLCPLTLDTKPVYCAYEKSMRLFPLPHVVVLADHYEQYQWKFDDCHMLNPGSFSADGSFVVYRPAMLQTEFSRVDRGDGSDQNAANQERISGTVVS